MKKIRIVLIMALASVLFLIQHVEASSFRTVGEVAGSAATVKAQPSMTSASLTTLQRGQLVTVVTRDTAWTLIEHEGQRGYVRTDFLRTPTSQSKIASSKGGVVVKAAPRTHAPTKATLTYGMVVEMYRATSDGWSFVQYGNITGYVRTSFIGDAKAVTRYTAYNVDVRNIASPSGMVIDVIARGTKVDVHSTLAGWSYVTAGKQKGYVQANYLQTQPSSGAEATLGFYEGLVPKRLAETIAYTYYFGSNIDYAYAYYWQAHYAGSANTDLFQLTLTGGAALPTTEVYEETRAGFTYNGFAAWHNIPVKIDYPARKGNVKRYSVNGKSIVSTVKGVKEQFSFGHSTAPMLNVVVVEVQSGRDNGLFVFELNKGLVAAKLDIQSEHYVGAISLIEP